MISNFENRRRDSVVWLCKRVSETFDVFFEQNCKSGVKHIPFLQISEVVNTRISNDLIKRSSFPDTFHL